MAMKPGLTAQRPSSLTGLNSPKKEDGYAAGKVPLAMLPNKVGKVDKGGPGGPGYTGPSVPIPSRH